MGYEPATASTPADSIFLSQAAYPLAEIVITPGDRPIAHLTAYAREYSTGTFAPDTMQLFNEYMFDCFLTKDEDKVKGYKKGDADLHTLNVRRFGRIVNGEQRDSVMRPEPYDEVTGLSFISSLASIPSETKQETEAMLSGALCDTISGKFYPKYFYRKSKNIFTIDGDVLADKKTIPGVPGYSKCLA